MKFAHFVPVCLVLLALAGVSSADISAPPPSVATVHLTSNGIAVTDIPEIEYQCAPDPGNDTVERSIILNCSAGNCSNEPVYMGSMCAYFPRGYFTYVYQGQNRSSEMFNDSDTFYRYYEYRLDVQTGKVTLLSASNDNTPQPGPCTTAFLLAAALLLVAFRRG